LGVHSDLFPKVSLVVTHGGSGTVLAALSVGVPLVIVPMQWDHAENAQRVARAGAGLCLAAHRCTPERLRAAVKRVLDEPSFRENAQRLAASFARYGGPGRAAELLERSPLASSPAGVI
jgi:UDP:flavonoid glycosyltransferase YjiC (YdhE family)